jgi:hypothetical protein
MANPRAFTTAIVMMLALGSTSAAQRWAQFRGPAAGVIADDPALPDEWGPDQNIAWKASIPGRGWSSPIVWDDHVFVTSVISDEPPPKPGLDVIEDDQPVDYKGAPRGIIRRSPHRWMLFDIDFKTGRKRWERELWAGQPLAVKHPKNSYASETPVTDGRRVYVYYGDVGLYAVDFHGNVAWSTRVQPPKYTADNLPALEKRGADLGTGASPALHDGRLYVLVAHEPEARPWFLAAFVAQTGREIWRVGGQRDGGGPTWATPFIWSNSQRTEIVVLAGGAVRSYDLDGKPLWYLRGLGSNSTPTPFAANGLLYVGAGYPADASRPVWAVRPGGSGDITPVNGQSNSEFVVWSQPKLAGYMPSALVYGNYLYVLESQGFLQCNDALTGERVYGRKRIDPDTSGFTASPWAYNDKIFVLSEDGETYVIQPGPEFKVLRKNSLGEMALATPAVVNRSLVLRTVSSLYRIMKSKPS